MQVIKLAWRYFSYFLNAVDEHSLHSPYVYSLYLDVIKPDSDIKEFAPFKSYRKKLSRDNRFIERLDLGAGSVNQRRPFTRVKQLLKSATPARQSRLFYRLIRRYRPENIIELGASLGLNTLYLAAAAPDTPVYTFEGCPQTAAEARSAFGEFGEFDIRLVEGDIDHKLPEALETLPSVGFVYVDANHTYEATLRYFEWFLPKVHENSVMIFDDIHWSKGMEKAWREIKDHDKVTLAIDLFDSGLVFFKPLFLKQHYALEY